MAQDSGWLITCWCMARLAHRLRTLAKRLEVTKFLRRLVRDTSRFTGPADRTEVAPRARAFRGGGGQEAELDRAIDDLEGLEADAAVRLADRDLVIDETAGRCAVEQAARLDFDLQRLLDREAVKHRLQDRAAADHRLPGRPVLSRFVVGDAQRLAAVLALDQINRPAQLETSVDQHGIRQAVGIAAFVRETKGKLEMPRLPARKLRQPPRPDAQIARDVSDLVLPDALDCRREVLVVLRGNRGEHRVERWQR